MRATDTPDGDRRPDLQHLSFQFRDIPRRHPVDPHRPVERRARPWHVQHQVMARIVLPPAVMRVLPSLASTQVSLVKDTSPVAIISVPKLSYVSLKLGRNPTASSKSSPPSPSSTGCSAIPGKLVDWIHRRWKAAE